MTRTIVIPAEPEALPIDIDRTAVIVVDMQNALCKKGGLLDIVGKLDVAMTERVVSSCRKIIAAARENRIPVIYLRLTYGLECDAGLGPDSPMYWKDKTLAFKRRDPSVRSTLMEIGDRDWEIIDELRPEPGDIVINKSRYSGFVNTDLDARLRSAGARYLLFTGLYINCCVESTLRDAFHHDYFALLVKDAGGTPFDASIAEATCFNVISAFGWVTTTEDLINALQ